MNIQVSGSGNPWKINGWNPKKRGGWFRWFSVSIGWFLDIFRFQRLIFRGVHSLKRTLPLKMLVSNGNFLFQGSIFRGYICFRECIVICPETQIFRFRTVTSSPALRSQKNLTRRTGGQSRWRLGRRVQETNSTLVKLNWRIIPGLVCK